VGRNKHSLGTDGAAAAFACQQNELEVRAVIFSVFTFAFSKIKLIYLPKWASVVKS